MHVVAVSTHSCFWDFVSWDAKLKNFVKVHRKCFSPWEYPRHRKAAGWIRSHSQKQSLQLELHEGSIRLQNDQKTFNLRTWENNGKQMQNADKVHQPWASGTGRDQPLQNWGSGTPSGKLKGRYVHVCESLTNAKQLSFRVLGFLATSMQSNLAIRHRLILSQAPNIRIPSFRLSTSSSGSSFIFPSPGAPGISLWKHANEN